VINDKGKDKVHTRTAHGGQRGSRGIAVTLSLTSALDGVGGKRHAPAALSHKDPVPIVQKAGWALGPVWKGAENLAPPDEIRSPDRSARS
jgi:hypothetical protein